MLLNCVNIRDTWMPEIARVHGHTELADSYAIRAIMSNDWERRVHTYDLYYMWERGLADQVKYNPEQVCDVYDYSLKIDSPEFYLDVIGDDGVLYYQLLRNGDLEYAVRLGRKNMVTWALKEYPTEASKKIRRTIAAMPAENRPPAELYALVADTRDNTSSSDDRGW